jgi:hypothetical protein
MDTLNWGVWFRGAISALSSGVITALAAMAVLKTPPDAWTLFVIGGIPTLLTFLSYIKQSPPPFGYKIVRDLSVPLPPSQVNQTPPPEPPKGG